MNYYGLCGKEEKKYLPLAPRIGNLSICLSGSGTARRPDSLQRMAQLVHRQGINHAEVYSPDLQFIPGALTGPTAGTLVTEDTLEADLYEN